MGRNDNVRLQHIIRKLAEMEIRARKGSGTDADLSTEETAEAVELCARLNTLLKDGKRRTWGELMKQIREIIRTVPVDFRIQSKLMETCSSMGFIESRKDQTTGRERNTKDENVQRRIQDERRR